jgi:hypothetical protein
MVPPTVYEGFFFTHPTSPPVFVVVYSLDDSYSGMG